MAAYLGDWLERRDAPASDLDLVVLLLNSLDLLPDPQTGWPAWPGSVRC